MRLAIGGVVGAGAVSWHSMLFSPTNPVITREKVPLKGLPPAFEGLRIVQLSDLHFSNLVSRAYLERCVEMTNALEPDLVFLTGDYVTTAGGSRRADIAREYVKPLAEILSPLRGRIGQFAVFGNHDVAVSQTQVRDSLQKAGFEVLLNQAVALSREGSRLPIVGLGDLGTQGVNQTRAFSGISRDEPALILMHHPDLFELGMEHRNGLIFAGHLHGGQVRIPFVEPLYVPSQFGAKYLSGRFQDGDLCMLVNRGIGVINVRVRFNARPEITLATLTAK